MANDRGEHNKRKRLEETAALGVVSRFGGDRRRVRNPRPETVKSKSTGPPRWGSLSTRWPSSGPAVLLERLNSRHS